MSGDEHMICVSTKFTSLAPKILRAVGLNHSFAGLFPWKLLEALDDTSGLIVMSPDELARKIHKADSRAPVYADAELVTAALRALEIADFVREEAGDWWLHESLFRRPSEAEATLEAQAKRPE